MKKIRIGNDFVFVWAIERDGQPEDLTSAISAKLTAAVFDKIKTLSYEIIDIDKIRVEFTTEICDIPGVYNLKLTYTLPDEGLTDTKRECVIDIDAFEIVNRSAYADDSSEFSITSDLAIAFKGDKGDPGPMATVSMTVNEDGELIATINN